MKEDHNYLKLDSKLLVEFLNEYLAHESPNIITETMRLTARRAHVLKKDTYLLIKVTP